MIELFFQGQSRFRRKSRLRGESAEFQFGCLEVWKGCWAPHLWVFLKNILESEHYRSNLKIRLCENSSCVHVDVLVFRSNSNRAKSRKRLRRHPSYVESPGKSPALSPYVNSPCSVYSKPGSSCDGGRGSPWSTFTTYAEKELKLQDVPRPWRFGNPGPANPLTDRFSGKGKVFLFDWRIKLKILRESQLWSELFQNDHVGLPTQVGGWTT